MNDMENKKDEVVVNENTENKSAGKNNKTRNIVIAVVAVTAVIVLLKCCGGPSMTTGETVSTKPATEESVGFNDSGEEVVETEADKQESPTVNYVLNSTVTIANGKINGLGLENNNEHRYVRAVYKLNDETVYDSKLIDVGGKIDVDNIIDGFNLPAAGEYETVCEMYSYDFEQNMRGQTNFEVVIIVQ